MLPITISPCAFSVLKSVPTALLAALVLFAGCVEGPAVVSFSATPSHLDSGGGLVVFEWETDFADSVTLLPGNVPLPESGGLELLVLRTTEFTLTARSGDDAVQRRVVVDVNTTQISGDIVDLTASPVAFASVYVSGQSPQQSSATGQISAKVELPYAIGIQPQETELRRTAFVNLQTAASRFFVTGDRKTARFAGRIEGTISGLDLSCTRCVTLVAFSTGSDDGTIPVADNGSFTFDFQASDQGPIGVRIVMLQYVVNDMGTPLEFRSFSTALLEAATGGVTQAAMAGQSVSTKFVPLTLSGPPWISEISTEISFVFNEEPRIVDTRALGMHRAGDLVALPEAGGGNPLLSISMRSPDGMRRVALERVFPSPPFEMRDDPVLTIGPMKNEGLNWSEPSETLCSVRLVDELGKLPRVDVFSASRTVNEADLQAAGIHLALGEKHRVYLDCVSSAAELETILSSQATLPSRTGELNRWTSTFGPVSFTAY